MAKPNYVQATNHAPLATTERLAEPDSAGQTSGLARKWIEVPLPALVSEEIFALGQGAVGENKRHSTHIAA